MTKEDKSRRRMLLNESNLALQLKNAHPLLTLHVMLIRILLVGYVTLKIQANYKI